MSGKQRVVVGLSGGVDSSVAAWLLKQQGYDVIGLFMINWHDTTGTLAGDCPWKDDLVFAELTARKIGIPFHTIDFSTDYKQRVVDYMFREYGHGRTPNPDVLCNREVKFDLFAQAASTFGAAYIATGHYCRIERISKEGRTVHRLLAGADQSKDQSYFLCQLSQHQLANVIFPVGHLLKSQVRDIAHENQLPTAKKKDSQGICFVGKVSLPEFLQQQLSPREGPTIEISPVHPQFQHYRALPRSDKLTNDDLKALATPFHFHLQDGLQVARHNGAHFFTVGQNKGLNIGGRPEQSFVITIDVRNNIVYTGNGSNHPGLFRRALFIPQAEVHWLREDLRLNVDVEADFLVRIRYRQALQKARLFVFENGVYILFEKPQRGITPGQFAAWYSDDELIGSGVIT